MQRKPRRAWTYGRACSSRILRGVLRVLLTNDDGLDAEGLQTLRRALVALDDIELAVVAPDENQSATARSISIRRPLWVQEVRRSTTARSATPCDGTPVDCVRLAALGLIDGFEPDVIVCGHQPRREPGRRHHLRGHGGRRAGGHRARHPGRSPSPSTPSAASWTSGWATVRVRARGRVHRARGRPPRRRPAARGHAAQRQRAAGRGRGVEVTRLGKRVYQDRLDLIDEDSGRKLYRVYGDVPLHNDEPGTDLAAVSAGRIAVTPLHFDLTAEHGMDALREYDLGQLLEAAE